VSRYGQELIGAMRVVAWVGLVSSSVSRLFASQRAAKCLRAAEAIQQSQAACCVPRLLRCCVPCLFRTHLGVGRIRPGPERKLLLLDNTQSKERNKSEQEGDHGSLPRNYCGMRPNAGAWPNLLMTQGTEPFGCKWRSDGIVAPSWRRADLAGWFRTRALPRHELS
jgi:hypothetical protein